MKLGVISPQALFRQPLCALFSGEGIFSSVVDFSTVLDTITTTDKFQQLVLIVHVTDVSVGIEAVCQLRSALPRARSVLLADDPSDEFCAEALEAGAWGCLSTSEGPEVVVRALRRVAKGKRWLAHRARSRVVERPVATPRAARMSTLSGVDFPRNSSSQNTALHVTSSDTAQPCGSSRGNMTANRPNHLPDTPVTRERRQQERYQIDSPVRVLTPGRGKKRTLGEGWLRDINDKGARFDLDRSLPSGIRITLEVDFLNFDGQFTTLRIPGVVKPVSPGGSHQMAVSFLKGGSFTRRAGSGNTGEARIQKNTTIWIN